MLLSSFSLAGLRSALILLACCTKCAVAYSSPAPIGRQSKVKRNEAKVDLKNEEGRVIPIEDAIQCIAREIADLQLRVTAIETSFTEIAQKMHAVTETAREALARIPKQRPSRLN
jgi:septal ring factor EnvC (AmiA/AmiB activator)